MEYDLTKLPYEDRYKLLNAIVVPRPIALITTLAPDGTVNAAPYSAFNVLTHDPPMVAVGVSSYPDGRLKDTGIYIRHNEEFVVNMVDEAIGQAMVDCSVDFPPGTDELAQARLTTVPSLQVAVPRIRESPVSLECRRRVTLSFGPLREIVIGEVVHVGIRDELMSNPEKRYVATDRLGLIGRMHGPDWYIRTGDLFRLRRLNHEEWAIEQERRRAAPPADRG